MKKSHMWLMLLCCLIPVVGLTAVYAFKVPLSSVLLYGMVLLCPLSHVAMMAFMGRDHDHGTAEHDGHAQNGMHNRPSQGLLQQLENKK